MSLAWSWTVPGVVVRVIDADTIVVNLDLGWRVYRNQEHIRVAGVNAPERYTDEGKRAIDFARTILPFGLPVTVTSQAKPSFERTVGTIRVPDGGEGFDYGDALVTAGYAVRV